MFVRSFTVGEMVFFGGEDWLGGRKRDRARGWIGCGVLDRDFPKHPDLRCWQLSGSAYSGVHAAICLNLPSMAIFP